MKHVVREIWFNCSAIAIAPNVLMNTRDITFIAPISSDPKVEDFYVCDDDGHIGIVKNGILEFCKIESQSGNEPRRCEMPVSSLHCCNMDGTIFLLMLFVNGTIEIFENQGTYDNLRLLYSKVVLSRNTTNALLINELNTWYLLSCSGKSLHLHCIQLRPANAEVIPICKIELSHSISDLVIDSQSVIAASLSSGIVVFVLVIWNDLDVPLLKVLPDSMNFSHFPSSSLKLLALPSKIIDPTIDNKEMKDKEAVSESSSTSVDFDEKKSTTSHNSDSNNNNNNNNSSSSILSSAFAQALASINLDNSTINAIAAAGTTAATVSTTAPATTASSTTTATAATITPAVTSTTTTSSTTTAINSSTITPAASSINATSMSTTTATATVTATATAIAGTTTGSSEMIISEKKITSIFLGTNTIGEIYLFMVEIQWKKGFIDSINMFCQLIFQWKDMIIDLSIIRYRPTKWDRSYVQLSFASGIFLFVSLDYLKYRWKYRQFDENLWNEKETLPVVYKFDSRMISDHGFCTFARCFGSTTVWKLSNGHFYQIRYIPKKILELGDYQE